MKKLMLLLGTVGVCTEFCSSLTINQPLGKTSKTPGKIVGYVDRKQLGDMSEAWHKLSTNITKKQTEMQAAVDKQRADIEATFSTATMGMNANREESREELVEKYSRLKEEFALKFTRLKEDAERELRNYVANVQQKIERMDEQAKKEVMAQHNAKAKDASEKLGSLVDKAPGMVVAAENDFTAEVAKAFDAIAEKDSSNLTISNENDLREKVSKKLFLANADKSDADSEKVAGKGKSIENNNTVMAEKVTNKDYPAEDLTAFIKRTAVQVAENTSNNAGNSEAAAAA